MNMLNGARLSDVVRSARQALSRHQRWQGLARGFAQIHHRASHPAGAGRGWLRPFVFYKEIVMQLDLVDEMNWEDSDKVEIISLEEAGLEEAPLAEETHRHGHVFRNGIHAYLDWFFDGSIENDDY